MRTEVGERGGDAPPAAGSGPRPPWTRVLVPWLVSQAISAAALIAAASWPFDAGLRFASFTTRWDGAYYLGIARGGYGPVGVVYPRWPFFPGLPAVIRGFVDLGIDASVSIHLIDQAALLVALIGVLRLASGRGSPRAAMLAVWALALFPAAFIFSMTYPSALFVAAMVWAFVLVEKHHDLAAGLLAAAATLLRPNGLVVALALVVAVWTVPWLAFVRRAVFVLAPAVLAIAAWSVYCWDRAGDPLVWLGTKSKWQEITLGDAVTGELKLSLIPHVLLGGAAVAVVVMQRRRVPRSWLVLTVLLVLPGLATGMVGMARYAVECFPPFIAGGQILERWSTRVQVLLLTGSAVGLVVFAFVVGRYGLVP